MKDCILHGNNIETLKTIPDESVDCCITSPPYYGLRDYGTGEWIGGDPNCPHRRMSKFYEKTTTGHKQEELIGNVGDAIYKTVCPLCGAIREDKQIGLEETPEEYIDKLVSVFREVKRILKPEGTLWVNIGDSYNGNKTGNTEVNKHKGAVTDSFKKKLWDGAKCKDLIGIPWLLAFALRNDGWYLRQDIIWHKPNPMPESVKDRCTKSHEYIFLLSKSPKYYFDYEAIQEEATYKDGLRVGESDYSNSKYLDAKQESSVRQGMNKERGENIVALRKNLPEQLPFVNFMRSRTTVDIIEANSSIKRSTIEHWFRTDKSGFSFPSVEDWNEIKWLVDDFSQEFADIDFKLTDVTYETDAIGKNSNGTRNKRDVWSVIPSHYKEAHFATFPEELVTPMILAGCPKDGVVLDPFMGSGTTGAVAILNKRHYIGCELNKEYIEMANKRIADAVKIANQITFDDLFSDNQTTFDDILKNDITT